MKSRASHVRNLLIPIPAVMAVLPALAMDYTWTGGSNNTWALP